MKRKLLLVALLLSLSSAYAEVPLECPKTIYCKSQECEALNANGMQRVNGAQKIEDGIFYFTAAKLNTTSNCNYQNPVGRDGNPFLYANFNFPVDAYTKGSNSWQLNSNPFGFGNCVTNEPSQCKFKRKTHI